MEIEIPELSARLEQKTPLLDVRMPDEYEEAHVPGAFLIPLPELPERVGELADVEGELLVICKAGGRSAKACEFLRTHGLTAVNVAGGTDAWIEAGNATVSGPESQ